MEMKNVFQDCGRFPKIDIIKMQEVASSILGWRCKIVPSEKPYFCRYCGEQIEKFKAKKYRACNQCYNDKYNKKYYEEYKDYFKEKNKERYEKDPKAQNERVRENSKKYKGYFLYKLFLEGKLVYIGSTIDLYKRARQHVYEGTKKFDEVLYIQLEGVNNNEELKWLEHYLIRAFNKPKENNNQYIKYKIEAERQQELLDMEKREGYRKYDLTEKKIKKWKSA